MISPERLAMLGAMSAEAYIAATDAEIARSKRGHVPPEHVDAIKRGLARYHAKRKGK